MLNKFAKLFTCIIHLQSQNNTEYCHLDCFVTIRIMCDNVLLTELTFFSDSTALSKINAYITCFVSKINLKNHLSHFHQNTHKNIQHYLILPLFDLKVFSQETSTFKIIFGRTPGFASRQ